MTTMMMFACLYTKHKTQKRKVWMDGRLVVRGTSAVLHRAEPPVGGPDAPIDACEIAPSSNPQHGELGAAGQLLEMEGHLVTIEGPWTGTLAGKETGGQLPPELPQKALPKFRKPPPRAPPPPRDTSAPPPQLANRKRPLQPGELQIQYYGASDNSHQDHHQFSEGATRSGHYCSDTATDLIARNGSRIHSDQLVAHQPPMEESNPTYSDVLESSVHPMPPAQRPTHDSHRRLLPHAPRHDAPAATGPPTSAFAAIPPAPPDHPQRSSMRQHNPTLHNHHPPSSGHGFYPRTTSGGVSREDLSSSSLWDRAKENRGGNRHCQQDGGIFSSNNGFDPSRFYGEDDDQSYDGEGDNNDGYLLFGASRGANGNRQGGDRRVASWWEGGDGRLASPSNRDGEMPPSDGRSRTNQQQESLDLSFSAAPPTLSEQRLLDLFRNDSPPAPPSAAAAAAPSYSSSICPSDFTSNAGADPEERADDFVLPEQDDYEDEGSSSSSLDGQE